MKWTLLLFALTLVLVDCSPKPIWIPYDGTNKDIYPGENWQKAVEPEKLGWSSAKLAEARNYSKKIRSAAVMIVDNGVVVDAWGDITRKFYCHSIRKSFLSALIGIHIEEGNIDLSKTMEELDIDDYEPSLTQIEKQATVFDLIRARSGIYHPALGEGSWMIPMRPERHTHAPGTFWYYNNWDFNALGTIFEQETGTKIFEEFDTRIARPLQMEDFSISDCSYKTSKDYGQSPISKHRYYQFRMSTRDLARFGLLYLRNGQWHDQQIVSTDWVRESTASHSQIWPDGGYGYMWWTGVKGGFIANVMAREHSFLASGAGVNKVIVLPYRKLVIIHRVDTFKGLPRQLPSQVGRLLWLILEAAGEKETGEDPSIEAAKGIRLTSEKLKETLEGGTTWVGTNTGPIPGGDKIFISCSQDGKLFYSVEGNQRINGKWWVNDGKLYLNLMGIKLFFYIIQDGSIYKFFDPTGTLFGKFELSKN
jgi:CubicO group peptidase (beta-lactamase class C family)